MRTKDKYGKSKAQGSSLVAQCERTRRQALARFRGRRDPEEEAQETVCFFFDFVARLGHSPRLAYWEALMRVLHGHRFVTYGPRGGSCCIMRGRQKRAGKARRVFTRVGCERAYGRHGHDPWPAVDLRLDLAEWFRSQSTIRQRIIVELLEGSKQEEIRRELGLTVKAFRLQMRGIRLLLADALR